MYLLLAVIKDLLHFPDLGYINKDFMFPSYSQQAYCQSVGTSPTNYPWIDHRNPTPDDIFYKIGQFWINIPAQTLWYLNSQSNITGKLQSLWIEISGGSAIVEKLQGNDGIQVSPSLNVIRTLGATVANATFSQALWTNNSSSNIEQFNIQLSTAIAATDATLAKVGVSVFDSSQFNVDANGFVTLTGGFTPSILGIVPDAHTAPGTTPVVPNGSGNIILEGGATFATATQAHPIRTNSLAANTVDLQIQLSGANAATSTPNNFGVSQFDSNSFGVTSGFVTLNNSGTTGAVTNLKGDDTLAVVPTSGTITLDGLTVLNATNAKPVFFKKNAASVEELDIQVTATSTSGAKNINNAGLASFDSSIFTVDANTGFVSVLGGTSFFQIVIQKFSTTGTYTRSANASYVIIECCGGGGGGGGSAANDAISMSCGGGGGSALYAKAAFSAATIGASQAVTIGAGGTGGNPGNGGNGGTTSVGALISAGGGFGGVGGTTLATQSISFGGFGGNASSGATVTAFGTIGSNGITLNSAAVIGGNGGSSFFGGGGLGAANGSAAPGVSFGAGGGGASGGSIEGAFTGGAGSDGGVVVTEFIIV